MAPASAVNIGSLTATNFATVYNLSRQSRGVAATITHEQRAEVENVFSAFSKSDAAAIFQAHCATAG